MTHRKLVLHNPIEKHFDVITRYHLYFFFLVFSSKLPIFWHVLNLIFLSPPTDYYCNVTDLGNDSESQNFCPCDEPWWDRSVFTETVQSKFTLICDKSWYVSFSESFSFIGALIGAFLFGYLSDKFGRLLMLSTCCLIIAVSGCLVRFMPSVPTFIIMRCIEGAGAGGAIVTAYVLCVEYCGVRQRETVTALFHLPINLSHVSISGMSYIFRHCDDFQLAISIPVFLFVGLQWLLMESPKWLMDNDYVDKAATVMEKVCKFNKVSHETIKEEIEHYHASHSNKVDDRISFWQVFKHKILFINLCCMSVIFFVCGMGYYGVSQFIGKMSGNIHMNVLISGTLLIPGTLCCVILLRVLTRRTFLMATNFLSGVFMIIVICVPLRLPWVRVVIACICNSFFFMSFIIVFLFGVELFPTSVRNSVLGFLSVVSRLGQIIAPQINSLSHLASGLIYGVMAMIGTILCYPLPETKNAELPSTYRDSKCLYRNSQNNEIENLFIGRKSTSD